MKRTYLKKVAKFKNIPIHTRLFMASSACFLISINFLIFSYNPAYAVKLHQVCQKSKCTSISTPQSTDEFFNSNLE